jgi:pimeloyl-ACP methyl ester carboxylesterase
MVFMAGWCLSTDFWGYTMTRVVEMGYRCVCFDRRGHGRSSDPGAGYDYDTRANDLEDVLQALDLQEVFLVAHSIGAAEAVRYLASGGRSTRVKAVALVAPALPGAGRTPQTPQGLPREAFDALRQQVFLTDFPRWLEENSRPFVMADTSLGMIEWIKQMMLTTSMQAVIDCNRAMTDADFTQELQKIETPALVVHGDADESFHIDYSGRLVADLIPGAMFRVYEKAPHGLPVTHSGRLADDLVNFLRLLGERVE